MQFKRACLLCQRNFSDVKRKLRDISGQATAELAIVMALVLIIVGALSVLSDKLEAGIFIDHAISAASHNIVDSINGLADAFNF